MIVSLRSPRSLRSSISGSSPQSPLSAPTTRKLAASGSASTSGALGRRVGRAASVPRAPPLVGAGRRDRARTTRGRWRRSAADVVSAERGEIALREHPLPAGEHAGGGEAREGGDAPRRQRQSLRPGAALLAAFGRWRAGSSETSQRIGGSRRRSGAACRSAENDDLGADRRPVPDVDGVRGRLTNAAARERLCRVATRSAPARRSSSGSRGSRCCRRRGRLREAHHVAPADRRVLDVARVHRLREHAVGARERLVPRQPSRTRRWVFDTVPSASTVHTRCTRLGVHDPAAVAGVGRQRSWRERGRRRGGRRRHGLGDLQLRAAVGRHAGLVDRRAARWWSCVVVVLAVVVVRSGGGAVHRRRSRT